MTAYIEKLHRFPLKGAQGHCVPSLRIDPEVGVVGDRQYGIVKTPLKEEGAWHPKAYFHVCMNSPWMAMEMPIIDGERADSRGVRPLHHSFPGELAVRRKLPYPLRMLDTKGAFNLSDTKGPCVSFLNLASVRALEKFMGTKVDPRRFRMNVWLEGLPAFEELAWVVGFPGNREIRVGDIRFRVDDACERCRAPEANPESGRYDLPIREALTAMMKDEDYLSPNRGVACVMGFLAVPLDVGQLEQDARIAA